jgi:hypothetical protein
VLFVGDDWAEAHHDIEIEDESGRVLVRRRLPEGLAGITTLHERVTVVRTATSRPHWRGSPRPGGVLAGSRTIRAAEPDPLPGGHAGVQRDRRHGDAPGDQGCHRCVREGRPGRGHIGTAGTVPKTAW